MKIKCKCGKIAIWMYMPTGELEDCYACDDCVPRGCSCWEWHNKIEDKEIYENPKGIEGKNWEWIIKDISWRQLNGNGKQLPCCEWLYDEEGFINE